MVIFGITVSLFVIAYVFAIALVVVAFVAVDNLPSMMLPVWVHHHRSPECRTAALVVCFLMWFGSIGLIASMLLPMMAAFIFALCVAGYVSFMRRKDRTPVLA